MLKVIFACVFIFVSGRVFSKTHYRCLCEVRIANRLIMTQAKKIPIPPKGQAYQGKSSIELCQRKFFKLLLSIDHEKRIKFRSGIGQSFLLKAQKNKTWPTYSQSQMENLSTLPRVFTLTSKGVLPKGQSYSAKTTCL